MEESIANKGEILINAGRRGTLLKMAPADIVEALACRLAAIAV
jgi:prolyl-tRNA editing enzyme YbaK/EbsC (Cys-tRNA(Pro) deacylase)